MITDLQFGLSLNPTPDVAAHRELAVAAEQAGFELIGVQDHPYSPDLVDAFALIGELLAHTHRVKVFPDVANLPLRPPAMMAKAAATLDLVSGGRFELAIGAGGYWDAIARMGVPKQSPGDSLDALEEAITVLRELWQDDRRRVKFAGAHYTVDGVKAGPAPAHPINVWVGAIGPRSQRLTGRLADGWAAPIPHYLPYEAWATANETIDQAAIKAGRRPADVLRMAQLVGSITDSPGEINVQSGEAPVRGTPDQWADVIADLAKTQPFRTFVWWPERQNIAETERFAREVIPAVHERLAA